MSASVSAVSPSNQPTCCLCGNPIEEDYFRFKECDHVYHRSCIAKWLMGPNHMCPVCLKYPGVVQESCTRGTGSPSLEPLQPLPPYPGPLQDWQQQRSSVHSPNLHPGYCTPNTRINADHVVELPVQRRDSTSSLPRPRRIIRTTAQSSWDTTSSSSSSSCNEGDDYRPAIPDSWSIIDIEEPAYYQTCTLRFIERLNLSIDKMEMLSDYEHRLGKYAVADAVNRVKIFMALDDTFRFTSVEDMLHKCYKEKDSSKIFDKIYKRYLENCPDRNTFIHNAAPRPQRGSVYHFFELPVPRLANPASMQLEQSFASIVYLIFGILLPKTERDEKLSRFYRKHPNNLHDVLRLAKLRGMKRYIKGKICCLKKGYASCKMKHTHIHK